MIQSDTNLACFIDVYDRKGNECDYCCFHLTDVLLLGFVILVLQAAWLLYISHALTVINIAGTPNSVFIHFV
jgi:hypothetical protein